MGFLISKYFFCFKKHVRIIMIGLNGAGKTSILYQLKLSDLVETIPTIGFNVEEIRYKSLNISIWDMGGNNIIYENEVRKLWRHYYLEADGIIFVVDSTDKERFEQAKKALSLLIFDEELKGVPLLVYANKQDLNEAVYPNELFEYLNLKNIKNNKWLLQGTSALNGNGIKEGFDWLGKELLKSKEKKKKIKRK